MFPGNLNTQLNGIPTSTDPIVSTIFAIESATDNGGYKAVMQIGKPQDLKGLTLSSPSRRVFVELEVTIKTPAENFANQAKIEISIDDARKLVKEVYNIDIPAQISVNDFENARYLTEKWPKSSLEKAYEFYLKAANYNIKK